jgi:hypothetical protein
MNGTGSEPARPAQSGRTTKKSIENSEGWSGPERTAAWADRPTEAKSARVIFLDENGGDLSHISYPNVILKVFLSLARGN